MKKEIVFVILLLLLVGIASAVTYQQGEAITFRQSCTKDNAICNSSASCNVTIKYPNSSYLVDKVEMSNKNNGDFEYNITEDKTDPVGEYAWDMYCCQIGDCGESHGTFNITPTGQELDSSEAIIYLALLGFLILVLAGFLYASFKIPWQHIKDVHGVMIGINSKKIWKIAAIAMSYFITMWIFAILTSIARTLVVLNSLYNFFFYFYRVMLALAIPVLILAVVVSFAVYFANLNLDKKIKKGLNQP